MRIVVHNVVPAYIIYAFQKLKKPILGCLVIYSAIITQGSYIMDFTVTNAYLNVYESITCLPI